jgi:two-component system response regulator (stage 0 sporulation protein F)
MWESKTEIGRRNMTYKILIVDDNKEFREVFRDFLSHAGYQTQEAADGREALDLLREPHDFDLVLLDVNMPGLNGMDVLIEIKKRTPTLNVIILTGHSVQDIAGSIPEGYVQGCKCPGTWYPPA